MLFRYRPAIRPPPIFVCDPSLRPVVTPRGHGGPLGPSRLLFYDTRRRVYCGPCRRSKWHRKSNRGKAFEFAAPRVVLGEASFLLVQPSPPEYHLFPPPGGMRRMRCASPSPVCFIGVEPPARAGCLLGRVTGKRGVTVLECWP